MSFSHKMSKYGQSINSDYAPDGMIKPGLFLQICARQVIIGRLCKYRYSQLRRCWFTSQGNKTW